MEQKFVSVVEHRATAASDDNGGGGGGGRGGGRGGAIDAQRDTLLLPTVSMSKSGYAASHAAGLSPCRPTHEQLSRRGLPLVGMDESLSKLHEVKLKPNYARIRHEAAAMAGAGGLLASSSDAFAEVGGVDAAAQSQGLTPSRPVTPIVGTFLAESNGGGGGGGGGSTFLTGGGGFGLDDNGGGGGARGGGRSGRVSFNEPNLSDNRSSALQRSQARARGGKFSSSSSAPQLRGGGRRGGGERDDVTSRAVGAVGGFASDDPMMQNAVLDLLDYKDSMPTLTRWQGQMHQPAFKALKAPYMLHRIRIGKRRLTML